ncbi:MAG: diversity-generating retroelement protein Avd [Anaerolineae bacterium]|nr:diversity-generating retroelement protein Avd [Anaerolineae bacterium]
MSESPIFVKVYDLLLWLLPKTLKFSREYRFALAVPIQEHAFAVQRCLVEAARATDKRETMRLLRQADVELTMLRYKIRLSRDLKVIDFPGYEHAGRLIDEVGRLLGGWIKQQGVIGVRP